MEKTSKESKSFKDTGTQKPNLWSRIKYRGKNRGREKQSILKDAQALIKLNI